MLSTAVGSSASYFQSLCCVLLINSINTASFKCQKCTTSLRCLHGRAWCLSLTHFCWSVWGVAVANGPWVCISDHFCYFKSISVPQIASDASNTGDDVDRALTSFKEAFTHQPHTWKHGRDPYFYMHPQSYTMHNNWGYTVHLNWVVTLNSIPTTPTLNRETN